MSITRVKHSDPLVDSLSKHIAHMLPTHRTPTPPCQMLLRQFMEPSGISQAELARRIGVSYPRVNELVNGKRSMTPDTALRLARLFDTSVEFWLTGQMLWDLWHVIHSPIAADIEKIQPFPVQDDEDEEEYFATSEQTAAD
jgi:addiction module HigA family antidote